MSSSAPLAIPAFMSIAAAALPAGFQVRYATRMGAFIGAQTLLVTGVKFSEDSFAELGPVYKHEEHYTIAASLCSFAGNDDEASRMAEVYALYNALAQAVNSQPTLNGVVRIAWLAQVGYEPTYDAKGGSVGVLDFEVQCQARVSYP